MKNYQIFLISLGVLFSACTPVAYFGDKLPPTTSIDIYYSAHDVTKQYKVIGHLTCQNGGIDYVKQHLSTYAKKIGADAVVITGSTVAGSGKNASDIINADALKYDK